MIVQVLPAEYLGRVIDQCLIYAPVVALAVSALKVSPLLSRWPKTVALVIVFIGVSVRHTIYYGFPATGQDILEVLDCTGAAWGLTVATFETILRPVAAAMNIDVRKLAANAEKEIAHEKKTRGRAQ